MKKKSLQHIQNTFPFLEESYESEKGTKQPVADAELVHARITWLQRASKASNEEFALVLMRKEPQGSAFHATRATVLSMTKKSVIDKVLKLEMAACAKKIDANHAHIKALYEHYSIAVIPNRADQTFDFKFPHESQWDMAGEGNMSIKLAQSGFPLAATTGQYSGMHVPASAIQVIEDALKKKPTAKRAKR
jgi:hypothetical protein